MNDRFAQARQKDTQTDKQTGGENKKYIKNANFECPGLV